MRRPHGLTTASPILILLILTLTLGLPIAAKRTSPPQPEHTQYLRLPFLQQGPKVVDERATSDGQPAHPPAGPPPLDQDPLLPNNGYQKTTYYRCRPDSGGGEAGDEERCGWHVPVVKVAGAPRGLDTTVVVAAVFGAAAMFAMALV